MTRVSPERQKLINFVKGRLPADDIVLSSLSLRDNHTFMLMGTVEEEIIKDPSQIDGLPEVMNDFDFDYVPDTDEYMNNAKNKKKLAETIKKTNIVLINELRPGKKMLVLDL
ncbi:Ubiquitin-like domain-containing CTD phosphatase 1, partial [Quaeritorhiza haematococci]